MDAHQLINEITASPRLAKSRVFAGVVFSDEPILRTASSMQTFLPQRYRSMRALAAPQPSEGFCCPSPAQLFVRQAHFMANWEDDCPYEGTFERYFPTYSAMNDRQLRGYFTWRAAVRRNNIQEASLSFAFVYMYELVNGIGGETPADCFKALKDFWLRYRVFTNKIDRYARAWLRDMAIWYNLPSVFLEGVVDTASEQALTTLREAEASLNWVRAVAPGQRAHAGAASASGLKLFSALAQLSNYRIDKSAFVHEHAEEVYQVVGSVFAALCEHCARRRKRGFVDSLFGTRRLSSHVPFASAVFWPGRAHPDCIYRINDVRTYSCRGGQWMALRGYKTLARNAWLGSVLHSVDRMMREACGFKPLGTVRAVPKYVEKIIAAAVAAWHEEQQARKARRVVIDRSQLAGIRHRAAVVCESLLVEEERDAVVCELPLEEEERDGAGIVLSEASEGACGALGSAAASSGNTHPLTEEQGSFLRALLVGHPVLSGANQELLADAVNEALFDRLGDTALEYGEGGLQIVEDYRDELEGIVNL